MAQAQKLVPELVSQLAYLQCDRSRSPKLHVDTISEALPVPHPEHSQKLVHQQSQRIAQSQSQSENGAVSATGGRTFIRRCLNSLLLELFDQESLIFHLAQESLYLYNELCVH